MPTIVLIHGMGDHTKDSFKAQFVNACNEAFNLYPSLKGKDINDFVNIHPVGYNHIFDTHRAAMADRAKNLQERLDGLGGLLKNSMVSLTNKLNKIDAKLGDDDFYVTHWLDVFFYRYTVLGEDVRIEVGKGILDALDKEESQNVHVLGHSLGTAVAHDTLAKLYSKAFIPNKTDYLSTTMNKFGSLHMVANTSRVLETPEITSVYDSVVKPGAGGCCSRYREYKHVFDPITWVRPFTPSDNNGWISHDSFQLRRYELITNTSITNKHGNTHAIEHYLLNPNVHLPLFKYVCNIRLDDDEKQTGHDAYIAQTMSGVARDLEDALDNLRVHNQDSVESLILAANTLKQFIEDLGGQYNV